MFIDKVESLLTLEEEEETECVLAGKTKVFAHFDDRFEATIHKNTSPILKRQ
jgi:hypothetical protein